MMDREKLRIGITQGDLNGVGTELILRTFEDVRICDLFTPVVYGSAQAMSYYSKGLGIQCPYARIGKADEAHGDRLNLIDCMDGEVTVHPGTAEPESGAAAARALERAAGDIEKGEIDALVTCPICKSSIHSEAFPYVGHTDFLEARFGSEGDALMEFVTEGMRIALATIHIPLGEVARSLSTELIEAKLRAVKLSLERDFMMPNPRIAVLALNPHAGENGEMGSEEQEIIRPAIQKINSEQLCVFGPYPADGFWGMKQYTSFDAVLAMYHDQGLVPFKTLAMQSGVNFTAGLPIVRTSPDHGTAYDIAGKGLANPDSFRAAIYLAIDVVRNRRRYDEARKNPLPMTRHDDERGGRRSRAPQESAPKTQAE